MVTESIAGICLMLAMDEGIVHHIYEDSLGYKTVGVGHFLNPKKDPEFFSPVGTRVPRERIVELFEADCLTAIKGAKDNLASFDELPSEAQSILVEMCFQMGHTGVSKFKKMLAALDARDFPLAAAEMLDSRWANQTPDRAQRAAERMLKLNEAN